MIHLSANFSALALMGLLIFVLLWHKTLKAHEVLICGTFGFLLAGSPLAPVIQKVLGGLFAALSAGLSQVTG